MSYTKTDERDGWGPGKVHSPIEETLASPPASPNEGDRYLVSAGTGAWSGHDGEIAEYSDGSWLFVDIAVGDIVFDKDQERNLTSSGSSMISSGGADGAAGADGVSITGASIAGDNLILTRSVGSDIDAGNVRGPAGADGAAVLNGTVDPTTEGDDGDFYINTDTDEIFGPKAGTWPMPGTSIVGPSGGGGSSVWTEAASEAYYLGNVGVGISNPSYELDVTGDINLTGDLRIGGEVQAFHDGGKIEEGDTSVEVTDSGSDGEIIMKTENTDRWKVTSGGHILPQTNAAYDIGSAELKVRHLFLSDNSLWVGDNQKITTHEGKMKFRSRKSAAPFVIGGISAPGPSRTIAAAGLTGVGPDADSTANFISEFDGMMMLPGNAPVLLVENVTPGHEEAARFLVTSFTPEDGGTSAYATVDAVGDAISAFDPFVATHEYVFMIEEQPMLNSSGLPPDTQFVSAEPDLVTESGPDTGQAFPGEPGSVRVSDTHLYICTSHNHWKRIALDGAAW